MFMLNKLFESESESIKGQKKLQPESVCVCGYCKQHFR